MTILIRPVLRLSALLRLSDEMPRTRAKSIAGEIQSPRNSPDVSSETVENSQNSKIRSKNYSAEECEAIIKCCDKFHPIISKNSSRDKDKQEKQQAWEKIKRDFDDYCQSQGICVSTKILL